MPFDPAHRELKRPALYCLVFSIAVGVLWAFPAFWYRGAGKEAQFFWLADQTKVPGWVFKDVPIAKAAEAVLVGDRMANGEFVSSNATRVIRVFSAKRYLQKENEIGLFSHTPDRCWTGAGWKIQLVEPEFVECQIHGLAMRFERRLFVHDEVKELVYFGAIAGGKALPYRLDQYLAASLKKTGKTKGDSESTILRLGSSRLWGWTWDSFVHRTAFGGPQQFLRISTPVVGNPSEIHGIDFTGQAQWNRGRPDEIVGPASSAPKAAAISQAKDSTGQGQISRGKPLAEADERLRSFLPQWLVKGDYQKEYGEWKAARARERR